MIPFQRVTATHLGATYRILRSCLTCLRVGDTSSELSVQRVGLAELRPRCRQLVYCFSLAVRWRAWLMIFVCYSGVSARLHVYSPVFTLLLLLV